MGRLEERPVSGAEKLFVARHLGVPEHRLSMNHQAGHATRDEKAAGGFVREISGGVEQAQRDRRKNAAVVRHDAVKVARAAVDVADEVRNAIAIRVDVR
jgi:hypothetical protein